MRDKFSDLFLSRGVNYYSGDIPFQVVLEYFGFKGDRELRNMGRYVSEEFIESLDFIDHYGKPVLQTWSTMGERIDYVRISPEHRRVLKRLQDFGIIRKIVEEEETLLYHFITGYVISDSGIFCTFTLTAQTAYGISKYASPDIKAKFLRRFSDPDDPWYGATFYSEVQGGSDLGSNRTTAVKKDEVYLLNGSDKYFASNAGIADSAIVTARMEGSPGGAKGISVFLVPAYRKDGTPNYTIRRLKNKLGTVAVPTGEVEFDNTEAYILGNGENGIQIAMEILTISRIDDAVAAVGIARKAFWEANLYAHRRTAFGKRLVEHPLMLKDLVEMESDLQAAVVISMFAARMFEEASDMKPPYGDKYHLARILSSIAKNMASSISAETTRYSMEIMGGIGFFEEFPMAKFHRDAIVTSIWEGTSNIQALEMLEAVVKKKAGVLLQRELESSVGRIKDRRVAGMLKDDIVMVFGEMQKHLEAGDAEFYSKEILARLGNITASVYMFLIGQENFSGCAMLTRAASVFHGRHFHPEQVSKDLILDSGSIVEWMTHTRTVEISD